MKNEEEKEDLDLTKITWENTGINILVSENKFYLTRHEKQLLKVLLYKYRPSLNLRKRVIKFYFTFLLSYGLSVREPLERNQIIQIIIKIC